jgi:hypothetical protein
VLSNKIQELNDKTAPLLERKNKLENAVKNAYSELINEFSKNKLLGIEVESVGNKIR